MSGLLHVDLGTSASSSPNKQTTKMAFRLFLVNMEAFFPPLEKKQRQVELIKISIAKRWNKKFSGRNKLSETAWKFLTQSFVMIWLCQNFHPSWWGECLWEQRGALTERQGQKKPCRYFYALHCNLLILFLLFISRSKLKGAFSNWRMIN